MPLLTLDELKSLLGAETNYLKISNESDFAPIEEAASEIVHQKTGLDIPSDVAEAPKWCKLPTALLCIWIASQRNRSAINEKFLEDTNVKYRAALDMLEDNKLKSNKGISRVGDIGEAYQW